MNPGFATFESWLNNLHGGGLPTFGAFTWTIGGLGGSSGGGSQTQLFSVTTAKSPVGGSLGSGTPADGGSAPQLFGFTKGAFGGGVFTVQDFLGSGGVTGGATTLQSLTNAGANFSGANVELEGGKFNFPLIGPHNPHG